MKQTMKQVSSSVFSFAGALAIILSIPPLAPAQGDSAALYKSKCAVCHGADGAKVAGHDLSSADVQKKSDSDLTAVIAEGRPPKMPKFGDKLKPEEIKGLVDYIRTSKK
jgi:mono/diheme cytochrome c family protein